LDFRRDFGYGGGSNVEGNFTISLNSADSVAENNIQSVTFLIDSQPMKGGQISQAPFKLSFKTADYVAGWHTFTATVATKDSRILTTPSLRFNFLSAADANKATMGIIVPVVLGVLVLMVLGMGSQLLILRNKPSKSIGRNKGYGLWGGVVCPHCGRPYGAHTWAINLSFATKYDRCNYCGKWARVHRASADELAAAEKAEQALVEGKLDLPEKSEEDKLKEMLDNSRYSQ
jgi:hypothetical protein